MKIKEMIYDYLETNHGDLNKMEEFSEFICDSKFVLINEPLMSNNGICIKNTNEFIQQTIKRVTSHSNVCR